MTPTQAQRLLAVACVAAATATSAPADHIPGHDPASPFFPVPLPGPEFFTGGVLFVTAIGPPGGAEIVNTVFDVTWVSPGETPASDLVIYVEVPLEAGSAEIHVYGSELGFGSEPGTYHGKLATDALNGVAVQGFFPPYSILDLQIGGVSGGIVGHFVDSTITFELATKSECDADLNQDGTVNGLDLAMVLAAWGRCPNSCMADFDGDGTVGGLDLAILLAAWGDCL